MEKRYFVIVLVVLFISHVTKINGIYRIEFTFIRLLNQLNNFTQSFYFSFVSCWLGINRLPTPDDGCGYVKVKNTRIIGGSEAPVGAWPWMALLISVSENNITSFDCGKIL